MGKSVNLIGKLGLEEAPQIQVTEDVTLTVDNSAPTILRVFEALGDNTETVSPATIAKVASMLFDDKSQKALDKLKLSFSDYALVVSTALDLITGSAEGESQTVAIAS